MSALTEALRSDEMRPTPRSPLLGMVADAMLAGKEFANKAKLPDWLGGSGLGDLAGQVPEEINEWSYGNAPLRMSPGAGSTGSYIPEVKPGRKEGLADVLMAAQLPGGKKAALAAATAGLPDPGNLASMSAGFVEKATSAKAKEATKEAATVVGKARANAPTVMRPKREAMFPEVYMNPRELVARAEVAPENPAMQQLFGVSRGDLFDISQQGRRQGNMVERPFAAAPGAKGAAHASEVMNPRNTQRLVDIIGEARQRPDLFQGMASWYTMDPLYQHFARLYGPEKAVAEYKRFNTLTGMASPGSEVLTEMNRGTAANWLDKEGRFEDFLTHGGGMTANRPEDMAKVMGHAYHKTAQAGPMAKYLRGGGELDMGSAKVPSYIHASGVPETGFQTQWPVGDAHWSRLVGLPDVRGKAGAPTPVAAGASASVPEMTSLGPWWKDKVAGATDLESVPAQAVVWGAGSNATGVTSPIGAPKLELLAQRIMDTSRRLGVSPEQARDMVILGKTHAGVATPEMLGGLAAGAGGSAALINALRDKEGQP